MVTIHLFSFLLFVLAAITLILTLYAWTNHSVKGSKAFGLLMLASTFYIAGYGMEIQSATVQSVLFWLKIQYLGIVTIPAACVMVAIQLTGKEAWLKSWIARVYFFIPLIILAFYLTNPWHHLFYTRIGEFYQTGREQLLQIDKGPIYWINIVFLNASLLFAVILFVLKIKSEPISRQQAYIMLAGLTGPWIGQFVYQMGWTGGLDTAPFGFLITAPLFVWGVFAHQMVFLLPKARRLVYHSIGDAIIIADHKNKVIDFNEVARALFSPKAENPSNSEFQTVIVDYPELFDCISSQGSIQKQIGISIRDSIRTFNLDKRPVFSKRGHHEMGWIILLREVTEMVTLMEDLKESIERYRLIFDTTPAGLMHYDHEGYVTTLNENFIKIIGSAREVLTGLNILKLPDQKVVDAVKATLRGEFGYYEDIYHSTTVDKATPVRALFAPSWGKNGLISGGVCILEDFSDRYKAEELIKYREEFETLLTEIALEFLSAPLGEIEKTFMNGLSKVGVFCAIDRSTLFLLDPDGKSLSMKYEWCRQGIHPMSDQFRCMQINAMPDWMESLKKSRTIYAPQVSEMIEGWENERKFLQQEHVQSVIAVPVETSEELLGFISFCSIAEPRTWSRDEMALLQVVGKLFASDIHRQKGHINLLDAKEKAEEASRIKSVFLANMSHEIRTPLNGILGFAELLFTEYDNPEVRKYAEIIMASGNRLLQTLSQILDLSRVESGKVDPDIKTVRILRVIDAVVTNYKSAAEQKGLILQRVQDSAAFTLELDEQLFRNALGNLMNNAIKFTNSGSVKISTAVENQAGNLFGLIRIADTGIGIPGEFLNSIFEDFRQVSEGSSRDFEGTGLGLSLAQKFVQLSGGTIMVTSREGEGSTFTMAFPDPKTE